MHSDSACAYDECLSACAYDENVKVPRKLCTTAVKGLLWGCCERQRRITMPKATNSDVIQL